MDRICLTNYKSRVYQLEQSKELKINNYVKNNFYRIDLV